ncbi:MAG: GIY-YIG nuclease family protein [Chitinophagales bacterium]|nr:GIY-YIG nuclease family protein [Chitinophagales bacterium]
MYAVYILACSDESYYTGLTNDLDKRIWEHQSGFYPDCYTFKRRPVKLLWCTIIETLEEATALEKQIKGWSRKKKEALIKNDMEELKRLAGSKK